nr:hypothetical protein [Mycoplasmopsis bovis]
MDINKYISEYFHKTKKILETKNPDNIITLQFFQRRDNAMLSWNGRSFRLFRKNTQIHLNIKLDILKMEQ